MDLFILTTAKDRSAAAITAADNVTPLTGPDGFPQLVLGTTEPLTVKFLSAVSTYESWTADPTYSVYAILGLLTADGLDSYSTASLSTVITNGKGGSLSLSTAALVNALRLSLGGTRWTAARLVLQIDVTDASGNKRTYAQLPVQVNCRVPPFTPTPDSVTQYYSAAQTDAAIVAERTAAATLTNKTISGSNNTISDVPESGIIYGEIDFEFSGTLSQPLVFPGISPAAVVPAGTSAGRASYSRLAGVSWTGSWGPAECPTSSVGNHITAMKFWNLININGTFGPATMPSLASIELPELITANGSFQPSTLAALTLLSAPKFKYCSNQMLIDSMPLLTTLSFPELVYLGGRLATNTMALLTTFSFPKLAFVGAAFQPNTMGALTSLSFPLLETVVGNFTPNTMALLTTFSFPTLKFIGGTFAPATMAALTTISLPLVEEIIGAASVASMASLTTVSLAGMKNYGSTITMNSSLGNLTTVTLGTVGTLKSIAGATINISGQKLSAATVNAILALLVSLDGTNGTALWGSGKTLTINGGTNAAPSGQGITDKATLQGRGATITTN